MNIERWEIDSSHSTIQFVVRHLVFSKVRGVFGLWSGTVMAPEGDFGRAELEVEIDASSVDTGVAARDQHLRRADFFDVKRYPDITFTARRVNPDLAGRFQVVGALTIRGITREMDLAVEPRGRKLDSWGNVRAAFTAKASIDRREFGITGNRMAQVAVGNRVDLEIEIEAVKQATARVA